MPFRVPAVRVREFVKNPRGRWILAYLAVSFLLGAELCLPGRTLYRWDTLLYNWPLVLETRSQWLSGHFPFWAPSFCCGTPLLENINAGVLYPLRVCCWLLPLRLGYHLFLFVHVGLSLVGMHLFLRRGLSLPRPAAFAGALAYAASGYARNMWDTHNFMALPWVPLGLAALLQARRPARFAAAVLATAFCWSMMVLGGDFQAACLWVPAAFLLAATCKERRRLLPALFAAIALGALLTAPQWIPSAFAAAHSHRRRGLPYEDVVERSFNPIRLVELLMPYAFGNHEKWFGEALAGPGATRTLPWTASFHVGVLALLLCAFAVSRRKPEVRWALVLLLASLVVSFGRFLPGFRFLAALPGLNLFRYPEKYLLWSTLALAVLVGFGTPCVVTLAQERAGARRWGKIGTWTVALLVNGVLATAAGRALATDSAGFAAWNTGRWAHLAVLTTAVWGSAALGCRSRKSAMRTCLALLLLDAILGWFTDMPTTRGFDPLEPPAVAQIVRNSDAPWGRVLRDPAAPPPLPVGYEERKTPHQMAIFMRESLECNSARLWGLFSADGFSPTESELMRSWRARCVAADDTPEARRRLAEFCQRAGVEWLLTTPQRAKALKDYGLRVECAQRWSSGRNAVELTRILDNPAAEWLGSTNAPPHRVSQVWRGGPSFVRVDLVPGEAGTLLLKETFSPGWRARDAHGRPLRVCASPEGLVHVEVPDHVSQVRLTYRPPGWAPSWLLAAVAALVTLWVGGHLMGELRLRRIFALPGACAAAAAVLFCVVGIAARNSWSCTFDEGFHLARGLALLRTGDSRLSYFHPPLQNLVCAYFCELAHGERLYLPLGSPSWKCGEIGGFAVDLAAANSRFFPDMIQAGRWGSAVFGAALCAVVAYWAARAAGPLAGWLAGAGVSLNPNILAHGHLVTTDAGSAFFAIAGTCALWSYVRSPRTSRLFAAAVLFATGLVTKHANAVWFAGFLLGALPLLSAARRTCRPFGLSLASLGLVVLLVVLLYRFLPVPGSLDERPSLPAALAPYFRGLMALTQHALEGHRAYFAGRRFMKAAPWQIAAAFVIKTPPFWLILGLASLRAAPREPRHWIPWVPAIFFAGALLFLNRLALGVRHALALQALVVWAAVRGFPCVATARTRSGLACLLTAITVGTAACAFPDYLAYVPALAGGRRFAHRWFADSNYDWGQDLARLESQWAAIREAAGGFRPKVIYYGFLDPSLVYGLPAASGSLGGYMGYYLTFRDSSYDLNAWSRTVSLPARVTVVSQSVLSVWPFGLDMSQVSKAQDVGRLGTLLIKYAP